MARANLPWPCLMLVTEPMERSILVGIVREAVAGGVNVVQLRDKTASGQELLDTALELRACTADCLLFANGQSMEAARAGAAGVHLPENGSSLRSVRTFVGSDQLVGRSVHSVQAAVLAAAEGADYLLAGTVFPSRSHPDSHSAGVELIGSICASVRIPVIAIGGISPDNCEECLRAGAAGVAVLSSILFAADPRAAARSYWTRLKDFIDE